MIPYKFHFDFGFHTTIKGNGYADGYMYWDNLEIFPILELIIKYINIIFKDGRKYIVGKGVLSIIRYYTVDRIFCMV